MARDTAVARRRDRRAHRPGGDRDESAEEERIRSVGVVNVVQLQVEASTGATSRGSPRPMPTR